MSDIRTGRIAALVLPCILGFARSGSADTVTYTVDLALQTTTWTQVAPLPRFNPALGTLQGIEVTLDGHLEGTARFENRDPQPATITTDFSANLRLKRRRSPLGGIFAVRVRGVADAPWPGVASLGTRPTVDGIEPWLETFLFDFATDLYGREIEVEFVAKIRDELRFQSLDAMVARMYEDANEARRVLAP